MLRFMKGNLKIRVGLLCLIIVIVLLGCGRQDSEKQSAAVVTAFMNVNVVPMDSERILENQTVIVLNEVIDQMGPASDIQIPKHALRIEGEGKYLMPGLADMHFHNEHENDFVLCLANGITTIRNMWGDTKHLEWRKKIENGELLGPAIFTAGPLLDGPPAIWVGSTVIETVDEARRAVMEQKEAGYDFIKIYDRLSLEVFNAILDEAKKQDIPVAGHIPFAVGVPRALSSGMVSNEHLTGYMEMIQLDDFPGKGEDDPVSRLRSWMYLDEQKIPAVLAYTQNSPLWECVTLVVYQGLASPAESYEFLKCPELKYLDPVTRAFWDPVSDSRWEELNEKDFEQRKKMDLILKKLTAALHKQGGHILLGTDCQNKMAIPGFSIHRELQNLVDAGLTPYEAIKSGTVDAATCLGVDTFGTVAPGKRADLILIENNPLDDVSHAKNIDGIVVRGQWLPQERLQQMLDDLAASYVPPENRFLEVPPLTAEGEILFSGHFEMRYADIPMAEERFVIERMPDGKKGIHAQAITDYPYGSLATLNMIFDDSGRCFSLKYSHETSTGKNQIEMVRTGEKLKIAGGLSSDETFDQEENVPEDLLLSATMLGNIVPILEIAKPLQVGEKIEIKGKAIRVLAFWFTSFVQDEAIRITRAADSEIRTEERTAHARVYEMQVSSKSFPHEMKIFVNDKGELHEVHLRYQQGLFKFIRLE